MKLSALLVCTAFAGLLPGFLASSSSSEYSGGSSSCEQSGPPNIVVLTGDGLGWDDIGWHNEEVDTPFLNGLAAGGVTLEQYYSQADSAPSRSAFITGQYPFHIGRQHHLLFGVTEDCLDTSLTILPEYLEDLGYATHMLGRWGLGFCKVDCLPTRRGFDTFYGQYNDIGDQYMHTRIGIYDWRDDEDLDYSARGTYAPDLITDRAVDIIEDHDCNDPLYLQIAYPLQSTSLVRVPPGEESVWHPDQGADTPTERQDYLKVLNYMDRSAERIVGALQDSGLYDNTLFVFMSYNGGLPYFPSSNRPLRAGRDTSYEGGTRVFAMVNSPLMSEDGIGVVSDKLMHVVDWVPTFLSLAGSTADLSGLDGVDQSNMLLNGGPAVRDEIVYNIDVQSPFTMGAAALRQGNYKLIEGYPGLFDGWKQDDNKCYAFKIDLLDIDPNYPVPGQVFPCEFPGYVGANRPHAEIAMYANLAAGHIMFFDLSADPEEKNDLSDSTDPVIVNKISDMLARLEVLKGEATPDTFPARSPACDPRITGQDFWGVGCCEGVDI